MNKNEPISNKSVILPNLTTYVYHIDSKREPPSPTIFFQRNTQLIKLIIDNVNTSLISLSLVINTSLYPNYE